MAEIKGNPRVEEKLFWHVYVSVDTENKQGGTPENPMLLFSIIGESEQEKPEENQKGKKGVIEYVATFDHDPTDEDINRLKQELESE